MVSSPREATKARKRILGSDLLILSVATGGTERLICDICNGNDILTILCPTFSDNSFASCLEAFSKLRRTRGGIRLILEKKTMIRKIGFYTKVIGAIKKLYGYRLGIIGGTSSWLVATTEDRRLMTKRLGVKPVDISMDELLDMVSEIPEEEVKERLQGILSRFDRVIEPKDEDISGAIRIYLATKRLVEEKSLSALTIRCFDLIGRIKNTACLALSLLNDDGVVAGCEGDMDSTLTMIIAKILTGHPAFMGNLNDVDLEENTITLAHCTVATTMCERCVLRSHFESRIGTSIQGILPLQRVTVCRIGESLGKMLICTGRIMENLDNPSMCRTQIKIRLDAKAEDLALNTLGNHHVVLLGDHREELMEFCRLRNITPLLLNNP